MSVRKDIDTFLAAKDIAVAGVSRNPSKFSNTVYRKLKKSGYKLYPINPNASRVEGDVCFHEIRNLPPEVTSLMVITSADTAVQVMREVMESKIQRVWVYTGPDKQFTGLETVMEKAQESGVKVISGYCPNMFLEPLGFVHSTHRFIAKLFGTYPK